MSLYINTENPYRIAPSANAVFTFTQKSDYQLDEETGNYTPTTLTTVVCTAAVVQKQDPNITLQPGIDYSVIYFEGVLVSPKKEPLANQSKNVTAVINGIEGVFDFIPVFDNPESVYLKTDSFLGQKIAGYFRITS